MLDREAILYDDVDNSVRCGCNHYNASIVSGHHDSIRNENDDNSDRAPEPEIEI